MHNHRGLLVPQVQTRVGSRDIDRTAGHPDGVLMVGVALRDLEAASAAGVRAWLTRTAKGFNTEAEFDQDRGVALPAFDTLSDALTAARFPEPGSQSLVAGHAANGERRAGLQSPSPRMVRR